MHVTILYIQTFSSELIKNCEWLLNINFTVPTLSFYVTALMLTLTIVFIFWGFTYFGTFYEVDFVWFELPYTLYALLDIHNLIQYNIWYMNFNRANCLNFPIWEPAANVTFQCYGMDNTLLVMSFALTLCSMLCSQKLLSNNQNTFNIHNMGKTMLSTNYVSTFPVHSACTWNTKRRHNHSSGQPTTKD